MPQLSLYIDQDTFSRIELAARLENASPSKYIVRKLNESMFKAWPENYRDLYGSVRRDKPWPE